MEKLSLMEDFNMKDNKKENPNEAKTKKDYKKFELLDELIKKEKTKERNA